MGLTTSKPKRIAVGTVVVVLIMLAAILGIHDDEKSSLMDDFKRIATECYDTVFLSMYPTESFSEEDFAYYRGMTVLKGKHRISGFAELKQYMKRIEGSENTVTTVYLGILPEKVTGEDITYFVERYPGISFEFLIACPSAKYWQEKNERDYMRALASWESFLEYAGSNSNAGFYFFAAEEWLITNPALFLDDITVSPEAAEFIFTHSDFLHTYKITEDKVSELTTGLVELTGRLRDDPPHYPDLRNTEIIFFGDSIFGNFSNSMSIPGVVGALTGATVYNLGYGGSTATLSLDLPISLPVITDLFFAKEMGMIPEQNQIYGELEAYYGTEHSGRKQCYIINYGLNDYFEGFPVSSDEPDDIGTYSGAIRTTVKTIREHSGDAQIILCTPTYTSFKPEAEPKYSLESYVNEIYQLGSELGVDVLDNYYALGIDETNQEEYLSDMIHPNEKGRFLMAQKIIEILR